MIEQVLEALRKSKFRSHFYFSKKDIQYVEEKGINIIHKHAHDFVKDRLSPKVIPNDGKQTPFHGHPVFIAQHATATCCRGCLYKWHKIPMNKELSIEEQNYIVKIIMTWIQNQLKK